METPSHRTERKRELKGIMRFGRETLSALGLALVIIVYAVQAYRIPSGSMEDSLLIGDQLLGLKFMYGAPVVPFTHLKFPGIRDPEPGDVVIFDSPDNSGKDYVKRCIAGPGQVIEVRGEELLVDGSPVVLPPDGKHLLHGSQSDFEIEHFAPLRVPSSGDTIEAASVPIRELLFYKHLIRQEHPSADVRLHVELRLNGKLANDVDFLTVGRGRPLAAPISLDELNALGALDSLDRWPELAQAIEQLTAVATSAFPNSDVALAPRVYLDGEPVDTYVVRHDAYFMLGDNRDNSLDSRYWGFVSRKFVKAQALIIYFSLDNETPVWQLPLKIRWERIGMLIRGWDGVAGT